MRKVIIYKSRLINTAGIIIGLLLITFFFISNITNTVALEQEVRCGIQEHTHTDECYTDDVLTCTIPEHTHDKNCYLVLLDENDINSIMEQTENDTDNSLNSVIDNVIDSAISYNSELNSQENEATNNQNLAFDKATVSLLNNTIQSEKSIPNITLNENINTFIPSKSEDTDSSEKYIPKITLNEDINTSSPSESADGAAGTSVMSVSDEPQTGNYNANFYIYLDGSWQCIGTNTFSTPYSSLRYTATMSTDDMLALINSALNTQYTRNSFLLYYSTSPNSSSWSQASVGTVNTTFGSSLNLATAIIKKDLFNKIEFEKLDLTDSNILHSCKEPYNSYEVTVNGTANSFYEPYSRSLIRNMFIEIINIEAPISRKSLFRKILSSWGISRTGNRVDSILNSVISNINKNETMDVDNIFYWKKDQTPEEYSIYRVEDQNGNKRNIDDICSYEIINAIIEVLQDQVSMLTDDLIRETAKKFGFSRIGKLIDSTIRNAINQGLNRNILKLSGENKIALL